MAVTSIPSDQLSGNTVQFENLEFVKLKRPEIIPRQLIENVKGRTFDVNQFYTYQKAQADNPYNHLYALIDERRIIHGFIWAEQNILDESLFVNTFSISDKYWGKGKAINKACEFVRELKDRLKSPRVFWVTTNEKFFSKHGFKRSRNVLMEFVDS